MNDGTIALLLLTLLAILAVWLSDRLSVQVERLDLNVRGWLKLKIGSLKVTITRRQRGQWRQERTPVLSSQGRIGRRVTIIDAPPDVVILTHPDYDHCAGLLQVIPLEFKGAGAAKL